MKPKERLKQLEAENQRLKETLIEAQGYIERDRPFTIQRVTMLRLIENTLKNCKSE